MDTVDISYRIDGGDVTTVSVRPQDLPLPPDYWADSAAYVIPVPARATGVMEVWARVNLRGGSSYWVSRNGANFKADVVPATQTAITFAAPAGGVWSDPAAFGPISGTAVRVRYDVQRMVAIMGMCPGQHTADYVPSIRAYVSFSNAAGGELIRYDVDASSDAPIKVPGVRHRALPSGSAALARTTSSSARRGTRGSGKTSFSRLTAAARRADIDPRASSSSSFSIPSCSSVERAARVHRAYPRESPASS